jgi:uncharacterized membrane-anchored protein YhcB (DUF1043 family)
MITQGNSLIALLVSAVLGVGYLYFQERSFSADLRKNTSETIDKLQSQLADLNNDYSESNNKSADTLQKIADTLVTLSGQIGKR